MFSHIKELFTRPSGYTIAKSVRLRSSASAYFNRTPASASNRKTWTWSGWVKRGLLSGSATYEIFMGDNYSTSFTGIRFYNDSIYVQDYVSGSKNIFWQTSAIFRDPSAWYHIVVKYDTTQASSTNAVLVYVNGVSQTLTFTANTGAYVQNYDGIVNSTSSQKIGAISTLNYFDGYLTEINFIDGQALTPSSFGETDSITGVWKAKKYSGTYGTNGFYLNFSDNSGATATTIGKDYSGNGNNWTPNNISVTAGATYDSMVDSPTVSAVSSNYCVMNPLDKDSSITISDANLTVARAAGAYSAIRGSFMFPTSGKYYAEATVVTTTASGTSASFGFSTDTAVLNNAATTGQYILYGAGSGASAIYSNGSSLGSLGIAFSAGDILQIAFDGSTGKAWVGRNNVWYNSTAGTTGDPANGLNNTFSLSGLNIFPVIVLLNDSMNYNSGQRPFTYTPPTGYVALNTYNLPASTITNGAAYMAATPFTSVSGTNVVVNTVNGVGFQPDLVWIKARSNVQDHYAIDSVRSGNSLLRPNQTNAESIASYWIDSFNSNGFTTNTSQLLSIGYSYIAWQWKAGGTSSSNTNGSITSTVSVGATQGFGVVTYTGTGANATVGHGLGVAPSMVIVKNRSAVYDWPVYHASIGATNYLYLDTTSASAAASSLWNNTAPTSSVFSIGTSGAVNNISQNYVAYCFAAVKGFSAFGSYTGNGSTDGPFVYLGFRPRFLMFKRTDTTANWRILDTSRDTYNAEQYELYPNLSNAEGTFTSLDGLSNGFKIRNSDVAYNSSGGTYIYAAFAENPFKNSLAR